MGEFEQKEPLVTFDDLSAPGPMRKARVGEHAIAYFDVGPPLDRPGAPVVLLHGLGEHAGYWSENVPTLPVCPPAS